jgi:hypothetical protein
VSTVGSYTPGERRWRSDRRRPTSGAVAAGTVRPTLGGWRLRGQESRQWRGARWRGRRRAVGGDGCVCVHVSGACVESVACGVQKCVVRVWSVRMCGRRVGPWNRWCELGLQLTAKVSCCREPDPRLTTTTRLPCVLAVCRELHTITAG